MRAQKFLMMFANGGSFKKLMKVIYLAFLPAQLYNNSQLTEHEVVYMLIQNHGYSVCFGKPRTLHGQFYCMQAGEVAGGQNKVMQVMDQLEITQHHNT